MKNYTLALKRVGKRDDNRKAASDVSIANNKA